MDPDEYIEKYGQEKFEAFIDKSQRNYIHFKAEKLKFDAGENDMKLGQNIKLILDDLKYVSDELTRDRLLTSIASIFKVEKNTLIDRVPNALSEKSKVAPVIDYEVNNLSLRQKKERYLTKIMMMNPDLLREFNDDLNEDILTFKPYYDIIRGLCVYFQTHDVFEISLALNYLDSALTDTLLDLDNIIIPSDVSESEINDYLEDLSGIRNSENEIQLLHRQLEIAERDNDIELQLKLTDEIIKLNRMFKM